MSISREALAGDREGSFIKREWITDRPADYRHFLTRVIPDFCIEEGVWLVETSEGVLFNDTKEISSSTAVPGHFRSASIKSEIMRVLEIGKGLHIVDLPGMTFGRQKIKE